MDEFGPVQVLVVGFDGTSFNGEIMPELQRLKELDIIRLVDMVVVSKDTDGEIVGVELSDLSDDQRAEFGAIAGALGRVLVSGRSDEQIIEEARAVIEGRERASKAIAVLLSPHIRGTVMTHSNSATVREAVGHTPPERMVCTVSEPGEEGRELDHLARHDHRHARLLRRLGEARCADLVHERAVAEDGVRPEKQQIDRADRVLGVGVVDDVDGELVPAKSLG